MPLPVLACPVRLTPVIPADATDDAVLAACHAMEQAEWTRDPTALAPAVRTWIDAPDERIAIAAAAWLGRMRQFRGDGWVARLLRRAFRDAEAGGHAWTPLLHAAHEAGLWTDATTASSTDGGDHRPQPRATEHLSHVATWASAASAAELVAVLEAYPGSLLATTIADVPTALSDALLDRLVPAPEALRRLAGRAALPAPHDRRVGAQALHILAAPDDPGGAAARGAAEGALRLLAQRPTGLPAATRAALIEHLRTVERSRLHGQILAADRAATATDLRELAALMAADERTLALVAANPATPATLLDELLLQHPESSWIRLTVLDHRPSPALLIRLVELPPTTAEELQLIVRHADATPAVWAAVVARLRTTPPDGGFAEVDRALATHSHARILAPVREHLVTGPTENLMDQLLLDATRTGDGVAVLCRLAREWPERVLRMLESDQLPAGVTLYREDCGPLLTVPSPELKRRLTMCIARLPSRGAPLRM